MIAVKAERFNPGYFRDPARAAELAGDIRRLAAGRPFRLMEVCGTHTVAIARSGLKSLLPPEIRLISGPGCPVCVTPQETIDRMIARAGRPETILATFGDMLKVPGSVSSLKEEKDRGGDVRIIYSPLEALELARENPGKRVVLPAVGFETTQAPLAAAVLEAEKSGLANFFLIPAGRLIPPALEFLLADPETRLDGLICPGHVSVIIGLAPYREIARRRRVPCAVAGFEPLDILGAVRELIRLAGRGEAVNLYPRAVRAGGNPKARRATERVFEPADSRWRGLGMIPASGLALREAYGRFDIDRVDPIAVPEPVEDPRCICGRVLRGAADPDDCPLFGTGCDPVHPRGPCMVSSEGACAARYRYGGYSEGLRKE